MAPTTGPHTDPVPPSSTMSRTDRAMSTENAVVLTKPPVLTWSVPATPMKAAPTAKAEAWMRVDRSPTVLATAPMSRTNARSRWAGRPLEHDQEGGAYEDERGNQEVLLGRRVEVDPEQLGRGDVVQALVAPGEAVPVPQDDDAELAEGQGGDGELDEG